MARITKGDLIEHLAEYKGHLKKESDLFIDSILESIQEKLLEDPRNEVALRGFGTFTLSWHGSRKAGSIKNGEEEREIPGHYRMHFKPSKKFKEKIREEYPDELDQ